MSILRKSSNAQSSVEFMVVIAFSLVMVFSALYLFYNYTIDTSDEIVNNRAYQIANLIVSSAEKIYEYGENASVSVEFEVFDGLENMTVQEGKRLGLTIKQSDGINYIEVPSKVKLVLQPFNPTPGLRTYRLINKGDNISIEKV